MFESLLSFKAFKKITTQPKWQDTGATAEVIAIRSFCKGCIIVAYVQLSFPYASPVQLLSAVKGNSTYRFRCLKLRWKAPPRVYLSQGCQT